jgi:hypothetical protein
MAFAKQSAKDTEGATFYFLKHLDGTAMDLDEQTSAVREGGDGQEVGFVHKTAVDMDGAMVANSRPEVAARLFAGALGADAVVPGLPSASASGLAQVHFGTPTSSIPYFTVEQRYADVIERNSNVQFTELAIEGGAGQPLKLTNSFIGGGTPYNRAVASTLTPARESGQPFFYPGASVVLDGAAAKMTKFKSTVRRNLDTDIRTTQLFREDVVALNFDTDFEGTLKYEDATLYKKAHYLAGTVIDPNALGLATLGFSIYSAFGAAASLRFIEVNQPLIVITGARVNKLDPDGKTMYLDIAGMGVRGATHQLYTRVQTASGGAF